MDPDFVSMTHIHLDYCFIKPIRLHTFVLLLVYICKRVINRIT